MRTPRRSFLLSSALTAGIACFLGVRTADADSRPGDGLYGRLDGDAELSGAVGAALAPGGLSGAARARIVYLQTAGAYATYTEAFGSSRPYARSFALGITTRPLFLPRWGLDLDRGPALLDLALDSLSFDLGAFWADAPPAGGWQTAGFELGGGFEIPLFGRASGPWLGFSATKRWNARELGAGSAGGGPNAPPDGGALVMFTLGWHAIWGTHLVDAGDALAR